MNPLMISKDELTRNSPMPVIVVPDSNAVITKFASDFLDDYIHAKECGRRKVVFILPVGPVGQYDLIAEVCNDKRISLCDLVAINMDDYLTDDGSQLISIADPLSFRRHMDHHFYEKLNPALAPPIAQRLFPDPHDLSNIPNVIRRFDGVDVCYCGVGINGHIAFNDPPEVGENISIDVFKQLSTRVVRLALETRLINSVTATRGNIDRIPRLAVTVGMKEVLQSRKVRVYMNRIWQSAIIRKILYGHIDVSVPASLLREHEDVQFVVADYVTELAEPVLQ